MTHASPAAMAAAMAETQTVGVHKPLVPPADARWHYKCACGVVSQHRTSTQKEARELAIRVSGFRPVPGDPERIECRKCYRERQRERA